MWRRYLALAHGYTASHKDGMVKLILKAINQAVSRLYVEEGAAGEEAA